MGLVSSFELTPACRKDIEIMAHIHVMACLPDNAYKLYFPTPLEFTMRVRKMLEGQVGDPTWQHMKVVDKKTGEIAAWASWNIPTHDQIRERDRKAAKKVASSDKTVGKGFPPGLPTHVKEETDKWGRKCTSGKRHMLCKALFTDPSFQQQGMGSALVKHGNQLADQVSLPIFVQALPFSYPVHAKHGYETVQHLDVDLTKWIPGAESSDKGYGNYRFRYMVRLPSMLSETH